LASHIVKQLLDKGYIVHASVRSKDEKKVAHLTNLKGSERIKFFEADLLSEGSFDACIEDAELVFHCASPYVLSVTDAQKQLVEPAVKGTVNVLNSCKKGKNVRRVILTSSMAAVTDSPKGVLNEDVWNEKSSLTRNPYYYSKTCAERQAWKYVSGVGSHSQKVNFDLVVINPFLIMGPAIDNSLNESNKVLLDILSGNYPVVLGLEFGVVDVRDVARAHIAAAEIPESSGRYVAFEHVTPMKYLCEFLIKNYPLYSENVPTSNLDCGIGNLLMKGAAHFQPDGIADFLKCNLGKKIEVDNSKIKRDLKIEFTPLEQTLKDTVRSLIEKGYFKVPTLK